jgi:phosphomannomutase
MKIPRHIFKAYDIRGLVGEEVTPELAAHVGRAFVTLVGRELPESPLRVVVGRDMRSSSPELRDALVAAMLAEGADVLDVGVVSTPAFYFSVGHTGADAAVMVTASHNPGAYNGFKMTRARAVPVSGYSGIQDVADLIEREDYDVPSRAGACSAVPDIPSLAAEAEIAFAGNAPTKGFRVVADSANGMGAQYLDELFRRVPCDVTRMYWDLDGTFPNHEADPFKEENTEALRKRVVETGADFGIATDGDGDRIFFIDETGRTVEPAIVRGLIGQIMLRRHPGATVCHDVRPGKITEDMIREAGGVPCVTRVGHSLIKEKMIETGAVFAGESSGHFFYAFPTGCYEGPVAVAAQLMRELSDRGVTLSELVRPLERYAHSGEINFRVTDKDAAAAAIRRRFDGGEYSHMDGISVTYPDFWFNVRASNTEPLLRLNLEAVDRATMEARRDEIAGILREFV